ncbi:MAG: PaaI family thioesterase [Solirubrobacterales bacterium]
MAAQDGAMIWQQPAKGGYPDVGFVALPGIERMKLGREGRMPHSPMSYLTELRLTESSRGHSTFTMPASPWFANSAGLISGGMLATIGDAALGSVVHSDVEAGQVMTTAELSLTFLRPVTPDPDGVISGSGQLIHRGRSLGLSEAFLFNDRSGELVAHGTSRCTVFPPIDPLPPAPELPVLEQELPGADPGDPLRRELRGEILDPQEFESRSGLEILRAAISGELPAPPIHHLTGLRVAEVEPGRVTSVLPCSKWLSTSAGTVQGGFTAMLADASMTAAVFTTAEAGTAIASLDLKVNYLRPVFPDDKELIARARVLHQGRTLAIATTELTNSEGKPVAVATGSVMYLPGRPANLSGIELGIEREEPE